jgi:hypothetical protein
MYDRQPMSPCPELRLTRAHVRFPRPRIDDVSDVVRRQLQAHRSIFPAGGAIAVAAGSRGIANIGAIVRAAVSSLAEWGCRPFVVPAMGSHGGATAEGQAQVLADYGVSPDVLGCDVRSSMDVVALDRGDLPHQLFMDRHAHGADGILLINRIKPHTDFHGRYESGLAKMAVIGLGKEQQAIEMHRFGVPGLRDGVPRAAAHVLATGKILAGLALVENAYDETMLVELVRADEMLAREPELLAIARDHMPRLAVDALDVLIVDRLVDKIDVGVTYTNVFTSGFPERGKIPIVAPTDADAYACALRACGVMAPGTERVARIQDTLHLGEIDLSDAALADVRSREDVTIEGGPVSAFDEHGRLRTF